MTLLDGSTEGQSSEGTTQTEGNPGTTTTTTQNWRDSLPDDLKTHGSLAQFKDIPSLAKSYVHAQSLVGKKGIIPPGEKASDEEWNHFYNALGRPEKDKYQVSAPEGKQVNPETVGKFKEWAHEAGLLPKQAQAIFNKFVESEESSTREKAAQQELQVKTQIEGLQKEWGDGFGKQVALAKLAVKEVGGEGFSEYLEKSGLGNDVQVIKLMARVGKMLGEDKIRGEDSSKFGQTPQELNQSISDIMGNPKHPYFDSTHPGHKNAVAQVEQLFKKASR